MNNPRPTALVTCLSGLLLTAGLTSCNVFSPFDHATSDKQDLSKARSCLDQGDYACALDYYQKLSPTYANVALSEQAFTILGQNGVGFGVFASTLGSGANGASFTTLAETLAPTAGLTLRLALYSAYQKVALFQVANSNDGALQALTRFLTSAALAAEMLAEAAGTDGKLRKSNLAVGGAACITSTCTVNAASCGNPTPNKIPPGTGDITTASPSGASPTLDQLYSAIKETLNGLNALGTGGSFSSASSLFTTLTAGGLPSQTAAVGAQCFRSTLFDNGVGE